MKAAPPRAGLRLPGWLLPNRTLRLTRDGWFFLAVTMAIGFASLNTGHNLFYLIFAMQVSLVIVSGLLSERAVRSLHVERRFPRETFARAATAIEIRVENRSRRRAAYAVEIRDALDDEPPRPIGFLDRLAPGGSRTFHGVWSFPARGRRRFGSVLLTTRFPFALFEKTRIVPIRDEVVVFPAIDRSAARSAARELSRATLRKNRLGEESFGLRQKAPEDDVRHVQWKVSAKMGELVVRDPGETLEQPVSIFFDHRGVPGPAFEAAVERAASLLWYVCSQGRRVNVYSWTFAAPGTGRDSWQAVLAFLAEVEPTEAASGDGFDRWVTEVSRTAGGVFVTSTDPPALPPVTVLRVA